MEKQDKSPVKFLGTSLAAIARRGANSSFNGEGGIAGLISQLQAKNNNTVGSTPQDPSSGGMISAGVQAVGAQAPTPAPAAMGSAPAPAAMGSANNANPFGGRTFTISPAQMKNVENVFGDINERQASVGQNMEQSNENYDAYGEVSPLMKKSCGSYKK